MADRFDGFPALDELGRRIVAAARAAEAPAPRVARCRRSRLVLIAALLLVALAGVAVAATQIIGTGRPVPANPLHPGLADIVEGTTRILSVRAPDPDGGPPWGLRVFRTRENTACVQVGRVVGGKLGVLGIDGVFANDHRFHELPVGAEGCGGLDARGQLFMDGGGNAETASGFYGAGVPSVGGCETRAERHARTVGDPATLRAALRLQLRRGERAAARIQRRVIARFERRARLRIPLCPEAHLRDVIWGFAGAKAQRLTLTENGHTTTVRPSSRESGAYLVVLRGTHADHGGMQRRAFYPGGVVCGRGFGVHSTPGCSPPPGAARSHRAPARPAPRTPPPLHVPITPLRGLAIRFVAPFDGHRYEVFLRCRRGLLSVRTPAPLTGRRPQTVRLRGPIPAWCARGSRPSGEVHDSDTGRVIGTFRLHG